MRINSHLMPPVAWQLRGWELRCFRDRKIMSKEIFTEKEAAAYIGMSRSYLSQDRINGYRVNRTPGPSFLKLGRSIRYRKLDLDEWLNKHLKIRSII